MKKTMEEFTGLYKLSQTLKFELKPVGKTLENLEKSGLLDDDCKRAEDYPKVKLFLDEMHKKFLQRMLSSLSIDWNPLAEALSSFQKTKDPSDKNILETMQEAYRKKIVAGLTCDEFYKTLTDTTPSKLFKNVIKNDDVQKEVKTFERFACYFKGYQENRKNIYSSEAQQTAAACRTVNENFTKYHGACKAFSEYLSMYTDLIYEINIRVVPLLNGKTLKDILQIDNYNLFLSQSGIDLFNRIVSEANYAINQYRQAHQEIDSRKLPFLPQLFKQILSDRTFSFIAKEFSNDDELTQGLKHFIEQQEHAEIHGENVDLFASLNRIIQLLHDDSDLYINAAGIDQISIHTTGFWGTFRQAANDFAENNFKTKILREKYCSQNVYSFSEIKSWNVTKTDPQENILPVSLVSFWQDGKLESLIQNELSLRKKVSELLEKETDIKLKERREDVNTIKEYLDTIQNILHMMKPLNVPEEYGGDLELHGLLHEHYLILESVIPIYNMIRNYITKKLIEEPKIKLMFNNPTLADGWDYNKELANTSVIFCKDGQYFLGIMNPKSKVDFEKLTSDTSEGCFQKMVYKLLPGPNKMLPKVFFAKKNIDFYAPSAQLLEQYENKEHIKGNNFNLEFCHELIDFFKSAIRKHPDWSQFGFSFSSTDNYNGIDEFYKEVAEQGYKISFVNIPEETLLQLVEKGSIYLFQIWNKDFSPKSTGTPNKSTLYWKAIFQPENLKNIVIKLNGEAELFLRPPAVKNPVVHQTGSKLVNKTIVTAITDGIPERSFIPSDIYQELYRYINGISSSPLSDEAKHYLKNRLDWKKGMDFSETIGKLVVKDAQFPLVKDKRFTEQKFSFHVPITINFKAADKPIRFNDEVQNCLRNNPNINIIGIDRGERNLIYINLIDQNGTIIIQKSFNIIQGVDYHHKLDQREKERDAARKSWSEIGQIKDLKAGYLSAIIHEIAKLMVEYNAILIMEDLNFGFKRGRFKIEKQVYQKFEKALIDKLNYLIFKNISDWNAPGGVLNGYQFADKFESFAKLGKQCGFIFYVPAGFTSKIDPATGFINLFDMKKCTTLAKRKEFFEKFDSIIFDEKNNEFRFTFDYNNFQTILSGEKNKWTVCSAARRLVYHPELKTTQEIYPTALILKELEKRNITPEDGFDLKNFLSALPESKENAQFFAQIFYAFEKTLQMRNSNAKTNEDFISSPVRDKNGILFHSSNGDPEMPQDADSNGAFHIALKGLLILQRIRAGNDGKVNLKIDNKEWFDFVQKRHS